jgi:hypothetical protein
MHSDSLDRLPGPRAAEAVALPRRHVLALAVLVCIPVPLLSFGGTALLPLHGLMERAVATFAPFVAPVLGTDDGRVVRRNAAAVRPLNVRLLPSETTHTRSRGASDAGSALDASGMPRTRTAKAPVARTKPKQRPKTPRTDGGSTPGTAAVPLPTDDDPHTGGSSGEDSGGSGESGSGGSKDDPGSGGGSGGGSGDGSGGSGSGGGLGGGGSGGGSGDEPGPPAAPPTPPTPPDPGGGGSSGGGTPPEKKEK